MDLCVFIIIDLSHYHFKDPASEITKWLLSSLAFLSPHTDIYSMLFTAPPDPLHLLTTQNDLCMSQHPPCL